MSKLPEKNKTNFIKKHRLWFAIVILALAYIIVYFCFKGNGFFSAGINLEKNDWLYFLGSYLTFAGTVIVSLIATWQTEFYTEKEKERATKTRRDIIQPIFSISIALNNPIDGVVDVFNLSDSKTYPQHKNVTISIENVGEYPIRNVIVFDKYRFQLLKPNDEKSLQIAYSDSPDVKHKEKIIELFESEYERTEDGIPKWFNISYDDIDGNEMTQTFELKNFEGTKYFSLEQVKRI